VNRAIRRYLHASRLVVVSISRNGEELKKALGSDDASPMTYNSPKPAALMEEDKTVEKWPLGLKPEDIRVVPAAEVFQ
jgi:zinc protease